MSQSFDEKVEALKSLLPLVWVHLALLQGGRTVRRYGKAKIDPGQPPPVWLTLDCNGRCPACEWEKECKGEAWELLQVVYDRKWRIATITGLLVQLQIKAPQLGEAVRAVYVEPYDPATSPVRASDQEWMERWANAGVRWMARKIKGDVTHLRERRRTKRELVIELLEQGMRSPLRIASYVGCSTVYVCKLKATLREHSERTTSAVG